MHQTRLHGRLRERRLDRLGEPAQPVDAEDQHVGDAALLELTQHLHPELSGEEVQHRRARRCPASPRASRSAGTTPSTTKEQRPLRTKTSSEPGAWAHSSEADSRSPTGLRAGRGACPWPSISRAARSHDTGGGNVAAPVPPSGPPNTVRVTCPRRRDRVFSHLRWVGGWGVWSAGSVRIGLEGRLTPPPTSARTRSRPSTRSRI